MSEANNYRGGKTIRAENWYKSKRNPRFVRAIRIPLICYSAIFSTTFLTNYYYNKTTNYGKDINNLKGGMKLICNIKKIWDRTYIQLLDLEPIERKQEDSK